MELLQRLHDSVYQQAQDWYQRLGSRIREQINRQYGAMPDKEDNIQVCALSVMFALLTFVKLISLTMLRSHCFYPFKCQIVTSVIMSAKKI